MIAALLDLTIEQGADFSNAFPLDYDLAGYAAAMQLKFAPDYPYAVLTLTTSNGGLVVDAEAGTVTALIPAATTTGLDPSRYVYDIKMFGPAGQTTRAYQGFARVSPEVTDIDVGIPGNVYTTQTGDPYVTEAGDYYVTES